MKAKPDMFRIHFWYNLVITAKSKYTTSILILHAIRNSAHFDLMFYFDCILHFNCNIFFLLSLSLLIDCKNVVYKHDLYTILYSNLFFLLFVFYYFLFLNIQDLLDPYWFRSTDFVGFDSVSIERSLFTF